MIAICLACEACQANRPGGCNGECLCTVNGRDIKENVAERKCPRNLFNDAGPVSPPSGASTSSAPCLTCGQKFIAGAIGLAKVAAQAAGIPIDQAPRKVEAKRFRICTACAPGKAICPACDCIIAAKAKIASERCPLEKW